MYGEVGDSKLCMVELKEPVQLRTLLASLRGGLWHKYVYLFCRLCCFEDLGGGRGMGAIYFLCQLSCSFMEGAHTHTHTHTHTQLHYGGANGMHMLFANLAYIPRAATGHAYGQSYDFDHVTWAASKAMLTLHESKSSLQLYRCIYGDSCNMNTRSPRRELY